MRVENVSFSDHESDSPQQNAESKENQRQPASTSWESDDTFEERGGQFMDGVIAFFEVSQHKGVVYSLVDDTNGLVGPQLSRDQMIRLRLVPRDCAAPDTTQNPGKGPELK